MELEENTNRVVVSVANLTSGEPPVERWLEYWRNGGVSYGRLNDLAMWNFIVYSGDVYSVKMYFVLSSGKRVSGNPVLLVNADGCENVSLSISSEQCAKIKAGLLREVKIAVNNPSSVRLSKVFRGVSVFNGESDTSFNVLFRSDDVKYVSYPLCEI